MLQEPEPHKENWKIGSEPEPYKYGVSTSIKIYFIHYLVMKTIQNFITPSVAKNTHHVDVSDAAVTFSSDSLLHFLCCLQE